MTGRQYYDDLKNKTPLHELELLPLLLKVENENRARHSNVPAYIHADVIFVNTPLAESMKIDFEILESTVEQFLRYKIIQRVQNSPYNTNFEFTDFGRRCVTWFEQESAEVGAH